MEAPAASAALPTHTPRTHSPRPPHPGPMCSSLARRLTQGFESEGWASIPTSATDSRGTRCSAWLSSGPAPDRHSPLPRAANVCP